MVDLIFEYCAVIMLFIAVVSLYFSLVSRIFPKLWLTPSPEDSISDRGVKKCVFPNGRSVAYEPKLSIRKYIKQYALFSLDGVKYIKCDINEKIRSMSYELMIYDRKNKVVERLEISENIANIGYSSEVMLPSETSFVRLRLLEVNGVSFRKTEREVYAGKKVLRFLISVFLLTFVLGLFVNYLVVNISDVLLRYFQAVPEVDPLPMLLVIFTVSAFVAICLLFLNMSAPFKIVWEDKKHRKNRNER